MNDRLAVERVRDEMEMEIFEGGRTDLGKLDTFRESFLVVIREHLCTLLTRLVVRSDERSGDGILSTEISTLFPDHLDHSRSHEYLRLASINLLKT